MNTAEILHFYRRSKYAIFRFFVLSFLCHSTPFVSLLWMSCRLANGGLLRQVGPWGTWCFLFITAYCCGSSITMADILALFNVFEYCIMKYLLIVQVTSPLVGSQGCWNVVLWLIDVACPCLITIWFFPSQVLSSSELITVLHLDQTWVPLMED